jgi:hypothetical protein
MDKVDLSVDYYPTPAFPLLRFAFAVPSSTNPFFRSESVLDITAADFQDFAVHLPTCFELTVFWYSGEGPQFVFEETVGILGNGFVEQVRRNLERAAKDYWLIPGYLRSLEMAKQYLPTHLRVTWRECSH